MSEGSEYDRLFYPFLFAGGTASTDDVLAQVRHSTLEKCREVVALRRATLERGVEAIVRTWMDKLGDELARSHDPITARTLVDRVVAGEYAIALNIFAHHPLISKAKGAPVNSKLVM